MSKATQTIIIALISAGLAALVNCIFQIINKIIDYRRADRMDKQDDEKEYISKKEKIYIAALDRLLHIRRGFDYTREMARLHKNLQEEIEKSNAAFCEIAPQLRLYSTDKIFNEYQRLAMFSIYAYAPANGPRLIENGKWAYSAQITLLARQMQEDLGYRKYNKACDRVRCPTCGAEHDMIAKCPDCGLSYEEMLHKIEELIKQPLPSNSQDTQEE
ncbi:MAG: hypothetical protein E7585_04555 [Ruminococcaceae bacterium]|nr:hypothetical protein [Oscillospiraceae bacterium]